MSQHAGQAYGFGSLFGTGGPIARVKTGISAAIGEIPSRKPCNRARNPYTLGPSPPARDPPMTANTEAVPFSDLGLSETVLRAVKSIGYESPSPIQAATIPAMLAGATCSARRRPAPARPPRSRCRSCRASTAEARAAGAGAGADARTRDPGRRGVPALRRASARLPRAADLRRPELRAAAERAAPRRARRRRHARPRHRPPRRGHARARRARLRWCSTKPTRCCAWASSTTSKRSWRRRRPKRQVALFSATMPAHDPPHRADPPARTRSKSTIKGKTAHRRQHPPALLDGQRPAQARRADAHPRGRDRSTR